ncbi:MAG: NAD-dependent epimerase/dehydratase family protein, partial [Phycisphaerales bacterium]|nr:NAD-dependent epimerase/dehydratase family protein [Phycisphaerales bacterium]
MAELNWSDQRIIITGGSGFLGRHIVQGLHNRGVEDNQIFIPRSANYDLTEKDACVALYNDCFGAD